MKQESEICGNNALLRGKGKMKFERGKKETTELFKLKF